MQGDSQHNLARPTFASCKKISQKTRESVCSYPLKYQQLRQVNGHGFLVKVELSWRSKKYINLEPPISVCLCVYRYIDGKSKVKNHAWFLIRFIIFVISCWSVGENDSGGR